MTDRLLYQGYTKEEERQYKDYVAYVRRYPELQVLVLTKHAFIMALRRWREGYA